MDSYSLKENKALVCKMNRSKLVLRIFFFKIDKIMTLAYQFLFTGIIDYAPVIYNSIYSSIYKVEINTYIQTCTKFSWCYTCIYKETICYDIDKYIYIYTN